MFSQVFENIVRFFQFNTHFFVLLLDLLIKNLLRAVVCHGCCLDDDVLLCTYGSHRIKHILRGHDRYHLYKRRRRDAAWSADQSDICAAEHSCFCQCIAHLAGRMVGDVAHRINGFLGRSGCDQNLLSLKILLLCDLP